ncbi:MAG: hypothetical protein KDD73_14000, partial [Anaerolineales bacterium]|nr:hypothetical protein [Anaerolineales bacterium]
FLAAGLIFGARQQVSILNSKTILAQPEDQVALAWMADTLPADATVAVSSWQWLGGTWSGSDGGAWIVPLTGRASTTPPADYIYDGPLAMEVDGFNQWASTVDDWASPTVAHELRTRGVTHLYVGARGGFLDPLALSQNPELKMIYHGEGTWLFVVESER